MSQPFSDQAKLAAIAVNQAGRAALRFAMRSPFSRWVGGVPSAYHLLILPQDLRTGDPSFAVELYDGYFGLAGAVAPMGSESPFSLQPPTFAWQRELYAFAWLRHLHASEDEIARERGRRLVKDWIDLSKRAPAIARDVDVTARRVIAVLSHATFLLDGVDPDFYDAVMRMLSHDLHDLTVTHGDAPHSVAKLRALTAILLAGLCVAEQQAYLSNYLTSFCAELDKQILADGGHISRDPSAAIEILLELFPLKQCFVARQIEPPNSLQAALDRILPMVRFLRLGDGSIARFNGMGSTPLDQLATILSYDDQSLVFSGAFAAQTGYARLARGKTAVLADAGHPPALTCSARAHAGCASFEMSAGYEPLIVNCGAPVDETSDWAIVARSTAAHSTLTINDLSSSRLIKGQSLHLSGKEMFWLAAPKQVRTEVEDNENGVSAAVSHDGYRDRFGLIHKRQLSLNPDGTVLEGLDQLLPASASSPGDARAAFAVRFHLHPRVTAMFARNSNAVMLTTPGAQSWRFSSETTEIDVEESLYFADPICLRRSLQIVLKGPAKHNAAIQWRIAQANPVRRPANNDTHFLQR